MAAIDSVYNYYLSTYANTTGPSRYDSHKKSELRDTYNKIIKSNKDSPLYKLNLNDRDMKKFAIDLKEQARYTQHVVSSLSSEEGGIEAFLHKKIAVSSNPDSVDVEYIGSDDSESTNEFNISVKELATPQINTGNFLNNNGHDFLPGNISFDLDTTNNSYEFQFTVERHDTNLEIQNRIARLVNTSDIGLTAEVISNNRGQSALQLTSKQTGLAESEDYLFNLQSGASWNELNRLGINQITSEAHNSVFTLNGQERSSLSNTFTINKEFEITLKAPAEDDEDVRIGFKANTDAIADSVQDMLNSYNGLLDVGRKYSSGHNNNRLFNEVAALANTMSEALKDVGIEITDDKSLALDRERMAENITSDNLNQTFATLNKFKNVLSMQADKVAVNPINYVDKLIVEYKNPYSNFSSPYAQSQYAGLILNSYM